MRLVAVESLTVGDATAEGLTACTVDLSSFRAAGGRRTASSGSTSCASSG